MTPEEIGLEVDGFSFGDVDPAVTESAMEGFGTPDFLGPIMAAAPIVFAILLVFLIVMIAAMWKVFKKAGKPGWAAIVPIYNLVVLIQVAKAPMWYLAIMLGGMILGWIPVIGWMISIASFVLSIILNIKLAKQFGKGAGFGVGLTFLSIIFIPILGFGKAQYLGGGAAAPITSTAAASPAPQAPQAPEAPSSSLPPQVPPAMPV